MTLHRNPSLIGLLLGPAETGVCRLVRRGKQIEVAHYSSAAIPASAYRNDPARAGSALAAHLAAAGLRNERCVVCLPLSWLFLAELATPPLAETDLQALVQLEAEKRFPLALDDMTLATACRTSDAQTRRLLLAGVPSEYLANVRQALQAAKLRVVSMTLGLLPLATEPASAGKALLQLGKGVADMVVSAPDALPMFRNLLWNETESGSNGPVDIGDALRQLRIAFAQMPEQYRTCARAVSVHGAATWPPEGTQRLYEALGSLNLKVEETVTTCLEAPQDAPSALLAATARVLHGEASMLEFAPKRQRRLQALSPHLSARGTRLTIGAVGTVLLLLLTAFGLQGRELNRLEAEWKTLAPSVEKAKAVQDRVRQHRAWYDTSSPSLAVLKSLVAAFPEQGGVWVKSLQVKNQVEVTCSGNASSREEWMRVLDKLGQNKNLDDVKVVKAQGDLPFTFTLTFRWKGGANER